jgi:DNA-directed RNA polymerase specialized sigma24 family protein
MLRKNDQAEVEIVRLLEEGKARAAVERGLAEYGAGLRGFVLQVLRSTADAEEAYGAFCEDLWHSLKGGQWQRRCSFLTWARKLAVSVQPTAS